MRSFHIATQGVTGGPLAAVSLGFQGGEVSGAAALVGAESAGQVGQLGSVISSGVALLGVSGAAALGAIGWESSEATTQLGSVAGAGAVGKLRSSNTVARSGVVIWGDFSANRGAGKTAYAGTMAFRRAA